MNSPDGETKRARDTNLRLSLALGFPLIFAIGVTIALFVVTGIGLPGIGDVVPENGDGEDITEFPVGESGGGSGSSSPNGTDDGGNQSEADETGEPIPPQQQLATGTVLGTVTANGSIPNATVTVVTVSHPDVAVADLDRTQVRTDENGNYALETLPVGSVTLRADGPQFESTTRNVTVVDNEKTRLEFTVALDDPGGADGNPGDNDARDPPVIPDDPDGTDTSQNDRDNDGILDRNDLAPDRPEDKDGVEDDDGLPETDADGDGVPDEVDAAPETPEDDDGVEDGDGAPETDADGDGINDENDAAPERPEDFDGFEDGDGAPDPNQAPQGLGILEVGDQGSGGITAGSEIRIVFTEATDPDGQVEQYQIDFDDGASIALSDPQRTDGGNLQVTHIFTAPGTYDVEVTAVDDDGATTTDTSLVTVDGDEDNEPPNGLDFGDIVIRDQVGSELTISVNEASDPDGTVVEYRWDFDDGRTATTESPSVTHTYTDPGTYELTITAVDDDGATTSGSLTVKVESN
jgi:hypothetical protein